MSWPTKLVIASGNAGKVREFRRMFAELADPAPEVLGLGDFPDAPSPDEDADTFEGNARIKALAAAKRLGLPALADDSGLAVDALDGRPGVHSARYAGPEASDQDNVDKLVRALVGNTQRGAQFVCALVLVDAEGETLAEARGEVRGTLLEAPRGEGGFGYDPLFVPSGHEQTMAELDADVKNTLSHRGRAMAALADALG